MKRSCRRSADENRIHDKAVKLRKMTDEQLVKYVEDRAEQARAETVAEDRPPVAKVLEEIMSDIAKIKGVGETKLHYIRLILKEKLEEQYG